MSAAPDHQVGPHTAVIDEISAATRLPHLGAANLWNRRQRPRVGARGGEENEGSDADHHHSLSRNRRTVITDARTVDSRSAGAPGCRQSRTPRRYAEACFLFMENFKSYEAGASGTIRSAGPTI
jgi:hypothetical protein